VLRFDPRSLRSLLGDSVIVARRGVDVSMDHDRFEPRRKRPASAGRKAPNEKEEKKTKNSRPTLKDQCQKFHHFTSLPQLTWPSIGLRPSRSSTSPISGGHPVEIFLAERPGWCVCVRRPTLASPRVLPDALFSRSSRTRGWLCGLAPPRGE
jgi:hypothetical protein